jgi:hypothetical protein
VAPAGHLQAIGFIDNHKLCGMKNGFSALRHISLPLVRRLIPAEARSVASYKLQPAQRCEFP